MPGYWDRRRFERGNAALAAGIEARALSLEDYGPTNRTDLSVIVQALNGPTNLWTIVCNVYPA